MTSSVLTIGATSVRQLDGFYNLNDLHRASGGDPNQRPNQFLRIDQTKALITEIQNAQICAFKSVRGRHGGTYAVRELVIAYAAWISAAFHLKVIRVFLNAIAPPAPKAVAQQQLPLIRVNSDDTRYLKLRGLCRLVLMGREHWPALSKALREIGSPFEARFHDIFVDSAVFARHVMSSFEREIALAQSRDSVGCNGYSSYQPGRAAVAMRQ